MFKSILDYRDENSDFNRIGQKRIYSNSKNHFIMYKPNYNYFGRGNKAVDQYNKKRFELENDANFRRTKNKIKLVVFKNGFILNNGPFRDKSLIENSEFLSSVEKGNIPQELLNKGIVDLGILLINRKTEIYRNGPLYHSLPISINYINFSQNKNKIHPLDLFFLNQNKYYMTSTYIPPASARSEINKPLYNVNTERVFNHHNINRNQKRRKTIPLDNFIKVIDLIEGKQKEKKYIPFSGKGQLLADAKIEIAHDNGIKNFENNSSQNCIISLRLYNGEVIKGKFNYNQTLRDVYDRASQLSGLNEFYLLDGFPPKPLLNFEKTIKELNLNNNVLTQKIK